MKTFSIKRLLHTSLAIAALIIFSASLDAQNRKTVSILGDSYSTFEGFVDPATNEMWYYAKVNENNTDVDNVRKTWWHKFITDNGYRLEKNNSYSGSTISYTGYQGNDYSARSFLSRMDNLGSPDMILIFGATNDSWAGAPIGDFNWDKNPADGNFRAFRPALQQMLSHMKDRYPNTEIIYLINDGLKPEITSSIIEACKRFEIPYLELHDIDKTAGHPNTRGMAQIASQLTDFLKK